MEDNNVIKIQVLNVFYPAFMKALGVCKEKYKMHIVLEDPNGSLTSKIISVWCDQPAGFFALGKMYGTYRGDI